MNKKLFCESFNITPLTGYMTIQILEKFKTVYLKKFYKFEKNKKNICRSY